MQSFDGKLAVITGGGTGMGRELARQLSTQGCHVAMCDLSAENMEETVGLCREGAPEGLRISVFRADVSDEAQMLAFRDDVTERHATDHIHLLFNNAGISGGGSFLRDDRAQWEKTFAVCWYGVYYGTRAFLPLLVASDGGHLVNTSSVNGFFASAGPDAAHTAYSAAKFAVKGFSEALVTDLRLHAPHVKVSVVMPGHIGTPIILNSQAVLGGGPDALREMFGAGGADMTDAQLAATTQQVGTAFRDSAPTSAAQAASIILAGVRGERWRILVGDDAHTIDRLVRGAPDAAYERDFLNKLGAAFWSWRGWRSS